MLECIVDYLGSEQLKSACTSLLRRMQDYFVSKDATYVLSRNFKVTPVRRDTKELRAQDYLVDLEHTFASIVQPNYLEKLQILAIPQERVKKRHGITSSTLYGTHPFVFIRVSKIEDRYLFSMNSEKPNIGHFIGRQNQYDGEVDAFSRWHNELSRLFSEAHNNI